MRQETFVERQRGISGEVPRVNDGTSTCFTAMLMQEDNALTSKCMYLNFGHEDSLVDYYCVFYKKKFLWELRNKFDAVGHRETK